MVVPQSSVCTSKAQHHIYAQNLLNPRTVWHWNLNMPTLPHRKTNYVRAEIALKDFVTKRNKRIEIHVAHWRPMSDAYLFIFIWTCQVCLLITHTAPSSWSQCSQMSLKHSWKPLFGSDSPSSASLFSILKLWDVHIINSLPHNDDAWGACLPVVIVRGSALENNLIGVHSQPFHSRSCCLFVLLKGPRCHGTYLHFSFGVLSCGHSPLCGSADIISFYTVNFMVGFAVCFTLRGCSLRKWLWLCL